MKLAKYIAFIVLGLGVAGCAKVDTVSRNAPALNLAELQVPITRSYDIQSINVIVPDDLLVSERNGYYPLADIVWRGDEIGDRKVQIADIIQTGMNAGAAQISGEIPVIVNITVQRFHSLTDRTRLSIGGVHSVRFEMTIVHAESGIVLEGPRVVTADLEAYGGMAALIAERRGQTQRVRLIEHFSQVIQTELAPGGVV